MDWLHKILLGVTECVNACMHGALQWRGIPARVYSCLMPGVPGIHCHTDPDKAVHVDELTRLHFLTKKPSDVQKKQSRSNNAFWKE